MKIFSIFLLPVYFLVACSPINPVPERRPPTSFVPFQDAPLPTLTVPLQDVQPSVSPTPLISEDWPLIGAEKRITKKPFGLKVSPINSPVQPERFSGYHTGVDYEIFEDENNKDVFVSAVCDGEILQKRKAQGYGGVVVQSCTLADQPVTIIYGHLNLQSIGLKVGDILKAGESFATLGKASSADAGGERKHLHLGVRKGSAPNLLGYVQKETELQGWIDFESYRKAPNVPLP